MRSTNSPEGEMSFLSHLIELRNRLLRSLLAVLVVLLALVPFANDLYEWLSAPLLKYLPQGTSMIATEVASPFFAPFKLAIVTAIFITMPIIIHQLWAFVAPGLYRKEKRLAYPLMITSIALFYLGAAFAYFAVFPLIFGFFTSVAPEGVEVATDISKYLDFVLKLFFAFSLAFEVPVATILLVSGGFTTPEALASKRPYVIVVAFIIGMLLTPPDVISQTLLALPMWILFEFGIFFSRIYTAGKEKPPKTPTKNYRYSSVTEEELDRAMGEGLSEALGNEDPRPRENDKKSDT
uniref:Sec-independent protein translocase protein TatC n=1 Tax=Candidatus Kentrum sp. SD TaxID=2126332 RepID=A0A450Y6U0_9GAMM|nr:MAG: sec-independent protein translocase protein TatC [Candidatus Kentron sp. SD]VFK42289.1 MAG: sec-independent protein translocase protein TatC [Candidatus Kentron sp. SD]VFK80561.1 MAG: sec-independent protein translocase protein TatC [Candidatus Kentron sp. SD]